MASADVRIELIKNSREIYYIGYTNKSRNAASKIGLLRDDDIQKYLVISLSDFYKRKTDQGVIISELNECLTKSRDVLYIIATEERDNEKTCSILDDAGINNYILYTRELDRIINNHIDLEQVKIQLEFLSVSVGQACNYKCKDCANFAPYAKPENMRYSLEDIRGCLTKVFCFIDYIDYFHIQGGEPFVYSELSELIEFIYSNFNDKIGKIQIATNGLLIPGDKLIDVLKRADVTVRISDYKNGCDKLVEVLTENNIKNRIYKFANKTGEWSSSGGLDYVVPEDEDVFEKVKNCEWNMCYIIENGLIGRCARSIPALSLQNVKARSDDYINLKETINREKIINYFMFVAPMNCCYHCKGTLGEGIKAAIQL